VDVPADISGQTGYKMCFDMAEPPGPEQEEAGKSNNEVTIVLFLLAKKKWLARFRPATS
jgi:hypothetical protein